MEVLNQFSLGFLRSYIQGSASKTRLNTFQNCQAWQNWDKSSYSLGITFFICQLYSLICRLITKLKTFTCISCVRTIFTLFSGHQVLLAIDMVRRTAYYLDHLEGSPDEELMQIVNQLSLLFLSLIILFYFYIKRDGNDQVELYRARLVVKGYAQKECIDFNEIFFPVVRLITVRISWQCVQHLTYILSNQM